MPQTTTARAPRPVLSQNRPRLLAAAGAGLLLLVPACSAIPDTRPSAAGADTSRTERSHGSTTPGAESPQASTDLTSTPSTDPTTVPGAAAEQDEPTRGSSASRGAARGASVPTPGQAGTAGTATPGTSTTTVTATEEPAVEAPATEEPAVEAPEFVHQRTLSPEDAPDVATVITIGFEKGDPVSINGEAMSPATLLTALNQYGHDNGVGRLDLVENRFVGMKSRGVYETPGGTILLAAHRGIESITLDGGAMHLKDELAVKYAHLVYNGFWFSPEREMLQVAIDHSQTKVSGTVRVKLYKGNATVIGRESAESLYDQELVTFEDGAIAYDQKDAAGFIKLNALRLRVLGKRDARDRD